MASPAPHADAFDALVSHLRQSITRAGICAGGTVAAGPDTISKGGCAKVPSWDWTCGELVSLLQQYPAGVTAAVMETQLLSQWHSQASDHPKAA